VTAHDYGSVTEKVGDWVTQEALSMLYTRYRYASEFCQGKRILEVACGQGIGLRYLAQHAKHAIGGDITAELLNRARLSGQEGIPLLRLDVETLPLRAASRDVIVCYEAIYYLTHPLQFLQECHRVLTPQGVLLLCTVNPEWPDFNPSPHSHGYYSTQQLSALLKEAGFKAEVFGAFPVLQTSLRAHCVSWIKRAAVALGMIPSTMAGKRLLKRLFLGRLVPFPSTVSDRMTAYSQPAPIDSTLPVRGFKILFAVGRSI
jgi:ubiquinone/menaquinone biosynthesis C-methylase UbiE